MLFNHGHNSDRNDSRDSFVYSNHGIFRSRKMGNLGDSSRIHIYCDMQYKYFQDGSSVCRMEKMASNRL
jgi:hypothetical protein